MSDCQLWLIHKAGLLSTHWGTQRLHTNTHKPDAWTGTHTQTFRPVIWRGGLLRCSPDFLTPSPSTLLLHSCCGRRCRSTRCQGEGCWLFAQQWPCCERSNCRYTDSSSAAVSTGCSTSTGSHTFCSARPSTLNNCTSSYGLEGTVTHKHTLLREIRMSINRKQNCSVFAYLSFPPTLLCSTIIHTSVSLSTLSSFSIISFSFLPPTDSTFSLVPHLLIPASLPLLFCLGKCVLCLTQTHTHTKAS